MDSVTLPQNKYVFVTWKRNVLFETAVLFAERWRHLTYSNGPNFINNALLVAKEYFHFKLSNVTKRATVACAQCASHTEAPSNGLSANGRTEVGRLFDSESDSSQFGYDSESNSDSSNISISDSESESDSNFQLLI